VNGRRRKVYFCQRASSADHVSLLSPRRIVVPPVLIYPTTPKTNSTTAPTVRQSIMSSNPSTPGAKREQRLIVVSNRLPVTIKKDASGKYTYKVSLGSDIRLNETHNRTLQMSSGGLVSALSGCKKTMSFTWIGWPGQDVSLAHLS
jgi:hypothetical protein